MSRSTQYIGLNKYALNYVKDAISVDTYKMTTGIASEPVYGKIYQMPVPKGPNTGFVLKEIVQDVPWSSGPMIFTCLEATLTKECGQKIPMGKYFCWMIDPSVDLEYDIDTGRYYA
jgi:hypothetical protein